MDRFLRTKDVAALLGVKPRTIIVKRCTGKLKLPMIKKDGMLGCFESTYDAWKRGEI